MIGQMQQLMEIQPKKPLFDYMMRLSGVIMLHIWFDMMRLSDVIILHICRYFH